jgi:EmrB/QacA subfamily drug resistance transporter
MIVHFVSMISSTIVANSGPTIVDDLKGLSLYAWVFSSYTLAATICVPIVGKLSDLMGRRVFYIAGLFVFGLGTAACGLSRSMDELIVARFVSGCGGGALLALGGATLGDIFPPRERARWMGVIMTNFGIASMLGPIVGGFVTDQFGWRWAFFIALPPTLVSLVLMGVVLPRVRPYRHVTIDWSGIALLASGLFSAVLALTWGGVTYPWSSAWVLVPLAIGIGLLVAFSLHELRATEPVMTPALFRNRVFGRAVALSFAMRTAFFGLLAFFPVYLQGVLGESASASGLAMVPMMVAFILGNFGSGSLISSSGRYRLSSIAGPATTLAGVLVCAALTADSPQLMLEIGMVLVGAGVGITFPLASTVVQSAFPYRILGTANSARQFFDNLGQVIGTTVMTTITIGIFTTQLARFLDARGIGQVGEHVQGVLSSGGQASLVRFLISTGRLTPEDALSALQTSLAAGLHGAFVFAVVVSIAGLLVGFVLPEIGLRTTHE